MGWILDLTTDPPDIYTEDTVKDNLHTCFTSPFPNACWYVNNNDIAHNNDPTPHICFSQPFPILCWYVDNEEVTHTNEGIPHICMDPTYPFIFWFTNNEHNDLLHDGHGQVEYLGAFCRCTELKKTKIAPSIKEIGSDSFTFTQLQNVTIAEDCTYGPKSFPENCTIHTYP